jgi:hypothetical protein
MDQPLARYTMWAPRVLALAFAVFVSLFALDVFDLGYGLWATLGALVMHLLPTWLLLAALSVAWLWPRLGALLFAGIALMFVMRFGRGSEWQAWVYLAGPPLLIAALFWLDQRYRGRQAR